MRSLIFIIGFIFFRIISTAQAFNDLEAMKLLEINKNKFGIEGIYQVYFKTEVVTDGVLTNSINDPNYTLGTKSICLYSINDTLYTRFIGEMDSTSSRDSYVNILTNGIFYKDYFGKLVYSDFLTIDCKSRLQTCRLTNKNNELSFEVYQSCGIISMKVLILLRKKY